VKFGEGLTCFVTESMSRT